VERGLDANRFAAEVEATAEERATAATVRVYAWDATRGIDAVGALQLKEDSKRPTDPGTRVKRVGPGTGLKGDR
jgi:hypothetical protein